MSAVRALAALALSISAATAIMLVSEKTPLAIPPAPGTRLVAERTPLLLLTALPLVFGESFGLDSGGSAALTRLEKNYRVIPIALADRASLAGGALLLAVQPRAQPAEVLVALDRWVRGGGLLLLLADPALVWPSERPLGDSLRPPMAFADTGLLTHWGLRLDAPDAAGPRIVAIGGLEALAGSPGALVRVGGTCGIDRGGLIARCRIGKGRVTVIADADFLDVGRAQGLDGPTDRNLDALVAELAALEPR